MSLSSKDAVTYMVAIMSALISRKLGVPAPSGSLLATSLAAEETLTRAESMLVPSWNCINTMLKLSELIEEVLSTPLTVASWSSRGSVISCSIFSAVAPGLVVMTAR